MKKIKVTIVEKNLSNIDQFRGIGVHTKELLKELKRIEGLDICLKNNLAEKSDIFHFLKFNPYFINIPFLKKAKYIITIHDLIPLIFKDKYQPGMKGSIKFLINRFLINKVDAVITISETSKKDIARILKVNPQKIFVTYLAPREIFRKITDEKKLERISQKYALPSKFVLYVGDVNYNKNLFSLAMACKKINIPLVIVGKQARNENIDKDNIENRPFIEFLAKFGRDKNIYRLGYVDDADLVCIYNLASVYCQPSFYEGFSLPVIEALASGLPVVASKIQVHSEMFKDSVVYADPKRYLDLAEKIEKVLTDKKLRETLIKKGFEKVKNYSWKKTAEDTYKVYKSLI